MSRLAARRNFYAAYVTAGDCTLDHCLALVEGGVDLLEIGAPFSDPVADGPVIQLAMERALRMGASAETAVALASQVRERLPNLPILLFGYANPFLAGGEGLLDRAVGVDGILVVDLPMEEGAEYYAAARSRGIEPIYLVTPSTSEERMELIGEVAGPMVYYACRKGTTGARTELSVRSQRVLAVPSGSSGHLDRSAPHLEGDLSRSSRPGSPRQGSHLPELSEDVRFFEGFAAQIGRVRERMTASILVGFGIADRATARAALEVGDGFVIGSAFVQAIGEGISYEGLRDLAASFDPRRGG